MKHLRHLFPLAILFVTLLLAVCVSAADSDYLFTENADGTLTITGYAGNDNDLVIPAEINGKKVTTIGAAAFDRWYHTDQDTSIYENIQTITVSEGITTFEVYAFSCMPGLTRIEIPKTVVSIETYAFLTECFRLREILVDPDNPNYMTIDNVLFTADCQTLITYPLGKTDTAYVIPDGVESIESGAFNCNTRLSSVTLPESLTTIYNMAFGNMTNLTSLSIPANVTTIYPAAFLGALNLSVITIDAVNTSYANDASGAVYTADMTELVCLPALSESSYTCTDTTLAIWDFALSNMQSLAKLHIPASISTPFTADTFVFCDSLTDIYYGGTISRWQPLATNVNASLNGVIVHYEGEEGLDIISGTCGDNLTWIKDADGTLTISGKGEMQDYSTTETGYPWNDYIGSFRPSEESYGTWIATTGIRKVVLEEGITSVAKDAFVRKESRYTYSMNSVLESVELPSTLLTIRDYAFSYCDKLTEITIPKSVTTVALMVFHECNSLENIYVEEGNARYRDIGGVLLSDKGVLRMPPQNKTATLDLSGTSVTYIDWQAFRNCVYLEQILFPATPDFRIDSMAFAGCTSLGEIVLPRYLSSLGSGCFFGCSNLRKISISEDNASFCTDENGILFNKDQSTLLCYPALCPLTAYTAENTVSGIDGYAFAYAATLESVTLPETITTLSYSTFQNCTNLASIYFYGNAPSIQYNTFKDTSSNLTLYYIEGKSGWTSPTWNGYNTATFVPGSVDPDPTVPGDIDGNGVLDYFDVSALYAAYLSGEVDAAAMDVNGDGVVDYFDAAKLYAAFRGTVSLGK